MGAHSELFKQLDTKHPDFAEWEPEWKRYRDVLGDVLVDKEEYLPKNKFEPQNQYDFRVEMSEFMPESGLALDRILGALYKEKPKRDLGASQKDLAGFLDMATRQGESWNAAIEQVAFNLIGYGTTRVLINVPPKDLDAPGDPGGATPAPLSRKEEQDLGVRPYLTNYSPLSVTDWEHDEDGLLNFVRIKEKRIIKTEGDRLKDHLSEIRFIEYGRTTVRWWVFHEKQGSGDDIELIETEVRDHGVGVVPMVIEDTREVKPMVGHSFVRYSSRADLRKFQSESDLGYDTYIHAHPFLKVWTEDDLKEIGLGTSTFIKLNPGQGGNEREDAEYVNTPASAFEALQNLINDSRNQIFRQAQVDPMGSASSGSGSSMFQASGAARAWSFGTSEARILARLATNMEQVENQVFEMVLRWQSNGQDIDPMEKLFTGTVQYPEEFDLASTAQLIQERAEIGSLVNSPTLLKTIDKRIAASKVGDASAKDLKKIQSEIESNPLLGTMAGMSKADPFQMPGGPAAPGGPPAAKPEAKNGEKPPVAKEPEPPKSPPAKRGARAPARK